MKMNKKAFTLVEVMIVVIIIGLLVAMVVPSVLPGVGVDAPGATRVLEQSGYTHVQITGYRWFAGGNEDFYHTGFSATAPNGSPVTGTVTRGFWFKSNTVRLD